MALQLRPQEDLFGIKRFELSQPLDNQSRGLVPVADMTSEFPTQLEDGSVYGLLTRETKM